MDVDFLELLEKSFVEHPELFQKRCLRILNPLNRCERCAESCPVDAINLKGVIFLDEESCIGCGVCRRVCPTEAWAYPRDPDATLSETLTSLKAPSLELICHRQASSAEMTSPARTVVNVKRCLASLPEALLLEAVAAGTEQIWLNDEGCGECPIGSVHPVIQETARWANALLRGFGREEAVFLRGERAVPPEELRRVRVVQGDEPVFDRREAMGFFGSRLREFLDNALEDGLKSAVEFLYGPGPAVEKHVPTARRRLLEAFARLAPLDPKAPPLPEDMPFGLLEVNEGRCVACGLCAQVCPTGAIEFSKVERTAGGTSSTEGEAPPPVGSFRLELVAPACIGCGVCVRYCPQDALTLRKGLPLAEFIVPVRRELLSGSLTACEECGTAFRSIAGERVCFICARRSAWGHMLAG